MKVNDYTISKLVNDLPFTKIQIAMEALDWRWATTLSNKPFPDTNDMCNVAIMLLNNAVKAANIKQRTMHSASGGLYASAYYSKKKQRVNDISIKFILCESNSWDY